MLYIWVVKYIFCLGWATSYISVLVLILPKKILPLHEPRHQERHLVCPEGWVWSTSPRSDLSQSWVPPVGHEKCDSFTHRCLRSSGLNLFCKVFLHTLSYLKEPPSSSLGWEDRQRVGKGWSCPHPPAPCQTAPRQDSRRSPLHHPFRTDIWQRSWGRLF